MAGHRMGVRELHHRLSLGPRHDQQLFFLPPPRGDTVEQAILDDEVGGPGVEGAGRPSPRSLSLESSSVLADRPRAVPWRKSASLNLLKHIKEKVSGLGGGLTVSRAVRGQQDGALSGTSAELPGSAAPGGAGGLGSRGRAGGQSLAVSPQKYRDGEGPSLGPLLWAKSLGRLK